MLTALAPFDGDTILPLADARVQVNLTADDAAHDAALTDARDMAIGWVENYTRRSLQERQFLWEIDQFSKVLELPIGPVTSVDEIDYYDGEGDDTALVASDWYLGRNRLTASVASSWPYANGSPGGVRITFTAGYAAPASFPQPLMSALKLALTGFFENRSNPDLAGAIRSANQVAPLI